MERTKLIERSLFILSIPLSLGGLAVCGFTGCNVVTMQMFGYIPPPGTFWSFAYEQFWIAMVAFVAMLVGVTCLVAAMRLQSADVANAQRTRTPQGPGGQPPI